jgi:hypothetical protein
VSSSRPILRIKFRFRNAAMMLRRSRHWLVLASPAEIQKHERDAFGINVSKSWVRCLRDLPKRDNWNDYCQKLVSTAHQFVTPPRCTDKETRETSLCRVQPERYRGRAISLGEEHLLPKAVAGPPSIRERGRVEHRVETEPRASRAGVNPIGGRNL